MNCTSTKSAKVNQLITRSLIQKPKAEIIRAVLIPLTFIALAGLLLADPWPFKSPVPPAVDTPPWAVDISPVRSPLFKPKIAIGGFIFDCSECHNLFPSPPETVRTLTEHRDIELNHGINNRCFNCHNRDNRDTFVDYKQDEIPYDQPQLLCAKCHGPVYRDWTHGVHGRTNGYWNPNMGPVDRRKCIECHDPHSPAFPLLTPAPAPNTLRMGKQMRRAGHYRETNNPLLIYRKSMSQNRQNDLHTPTDIKATNEDNN